MGFLFPSGSGGDKVQQDTSAELWAKMECKACPLNNAAVKSPKMLPTGSREPIVYIIGEAPGADEDTEGRQFVGKAGQLLRPNIPPQWLEHIRWNNVIRDRPPNNRTPERREIECCRPSIVRDIEEAQPVAIFGLGGVTLQWALNQQKISNWRGRRVPIKVGTHTCWFYPMFHPSFIARGKSNSYKTPNEQVFELDLKRAFEEIPRLPAPVVHTPEDARGGVECVNGHHAGDLEHVLDFLEWAAKFDTGLDYETNGFRPYIRNSKILTIAISTGKHSLAFAYQHRQSGWTETQRQKVADGYCRFLLAQHGTKAVHNLSFEMEWTAFHFGKQYLRGSRWDDTQSQVYILDERIDRKTSPGLQSLEFLVLQHFGFNLKDINRHLDKSRLDEEPIDEVLLYNGMDAKYHKLAFSVQKIEIERQGLVDIYERQLRRVPTLVLTQLEGVPVNQKINRELSSRYADRLVEVSQGIRDSDEAKQFARIVGHAFKPGSDDDVVLLLKQVLKTRKGQSAAPEDANKWSCDKTVLSAVDTPLCHLVLRHREATKAKSTYVDSVGVGTRNSNIFPDGKIHCSFPTTFTGTGRLSSREPNMQNWPKRSEEMREVRRQFEAPPGYVILSPDFGQIEARCFPMYSHDPVYIKALWENYDIHSEWTEKVVKTYPNWISQGVPGVRAPSGTLDDFWAGSKKTASAGDKKFYKWWRDIIKNKWTFALFFGSAIESVAADLGISDDRLKGLYKEWWKTFAVTQEWQERLVKEFYRKGYVESLTGRRRRAPLRRNQIINTPIQGLTCDIVQDGFDRLSEKGIQAFLQIHDDLPFMVPESEVEDYAEKIISELLYPTFPFINVPLSIEVAVGKNWLNMKDIGTFNSYGWHKLPTPPVGTNLEYLG